MKLDNVMPRKEALKSLIKAMKELHLQKVKGYAKADDDAPSLVAKVKEKESPDEDMTDMDEDKEPEELE
jgi:hypothetical protein